MSIDSEEFKNSLKQTIFEIPDSVKSNLDRVKQNIQQCLARYLLNYDTSIIIKGMYETIKANGRYYTEYPFNIEAMYNQKMKSFVIIISLPVVNRPKTVAVFVVSQSRIYIEEINDNNIKKNGYTSSVKIEDRIDARYGTIEYEKKPEELADSKPVLTDPEKENQIESKIIPKIKEADENDYGITSIDETIDQGLLQKALDIYNERFGKKLIWVYNTKDSNGRTYLRVPKNKSGLLKLKDGTLFASRDDLNKYLSDLSDLLEKELLKLVMIQPEEAYSIIDDKALYRKGWKLYSSHYGEMESMSYKPGDIIEFTIFQLPEEDVIIKFHIDLNGKKRNNNNNR